MKRIQDSFEKLTNLKFADENCDKHTFNKRGKEVVKLVRKMIDDAGTVYCPAAWLKSKIRFYFNKQIITIKRLIESGRKTYFFNIASLKTNPLQNQDCLHTTQIVKKRKKTKKSYENY